MSYKGSLVSAIITTHNRADLLKRAILSVVKQTYKNIEIIVVDDGSTDHTPAVVKKLQDEYEIVYFRHEKSQGAPAARNLGIKKAKGLFIAGLDDDDEWLPERLEKMVEAYDDRWAYVTSDVFVQTKVRRYVNKAKKVIKLHDMLMYNLAGNQILTKKERLVELSGFDEDLKAAQDYDMFLRLNREYGAALNIQEPLQVVYTDHNYSMITEKADKGYYQFYLKHKELMNYDQRKYQLFVIKRSKQYQSLYAIMKFVPLNMWFREVLFYLKHKFISSKT